MPNLLTCFYLILTRVLPFVIGVSVGLVVLPSWAKTTLAASPFETYVSDDGEPARLNKIVTAVFEKANVEVELQVMRDAFLGSSVLTGKVDGEFAYLDLGETKSDFLLSDVYLPVYLYAVSKRYDVENVKLFPHLNNHRVAIENRFANTPTFRLLKGIKWSRNPSTFDAFRQLADDRAPYLITTQLLANEFNALLAYDNEELLHFSAKPLVQTGFQLAIRNTAVNAKETINAFNLALADIQRNGEYNALLGIAWLTKDINGDGVADFIGHSSVTRPFHRHALAYSLDGKATSEKSLFVIDGQHYTTRELSDAALAHAPVNDTKPSLLDAAIYGQLIRKW